MDIDYERLYNFTYNNDTQMVLNYDEILNNKGKTLKRTIVELEGNNNDSHLPTKKK